MTTEIITGAFDGVANAFFVQFADSASGVQVLNGMLGFDGVAWPYLVWQFDPAGSGGSGTADTIYYARHRGSR